MNESVPLQVIVTFLIAPYHLATVQRAAHVKMLDQTTRSGIKTRKVTKTKLATHGYDL